jgi:sporulation protein YlmC with PRC-barrel domain
MFRKDEVDGKMVIEASGKALGKAKDIAFGLDGSVALIVVGNDNNEVQIAMDRVAGVADYIVVRRELKGDAALKKPQAVAPVSAPGPAPPQLRMTPAPSAVPSAAAGVACKNCGAPLRVGAKFCTKCGTPT